MDCALQNALKGVSQKRKAEIALAVSQGNDTYTGPADASHVFVCEQMQLRDGSTFAWSFFHPVRLVQHVLDNCPALAKAYLEQLGPGQHTLKLVFGCDEHTPGSKIVARNLRKNCAFMFNFEDLGADLLEQDYSWFIPCVVRSHIVKEVDGEWSVFLRILMRFLMMFEEQPVTVQVGNEVLCFKAKLHNGITDGEGFMLTHQWNGASGIRPDLFHSNVYSISSNMADGINYFDITCHEPEKLRLWNADRWLKNIDDVLEARQQYADGIITITKLRDIIKCAGYKVTHNGLLGNVADGLGDEFRKRQLTVAS